jgi:hypothetical protein
MGQVPGDSKLAILSSSAHPLVNLAGFSENSGFGTGAKKKGRPGNRCPPMVTVAEPAMSNRPPQWLT